MISRISDGCRAIAQQMIDNPEDWIQTDYEFTNKTNKDIKIWTANGTTCIKLNGNDAFNGAEKKHIMAAIKKSIANRLLKG